MLDRHKIDIQHALDDLFHNKLIPFKLVARKITEEYLGEFTIHFYDSRLHSVIVGAVKGISFAPQVRAAVLKRLGGRRQSSTHANVRN
ncbi:MAG TPA: hypothetical protein VGO68_05970 [Pyrinomonadaceae bacterium]|jgi:hypothetical protein|nr:hypothetical protein [Pyrinomonadaceae bacterium]